LGRQIGLRQPTRSQGEEEKEEEIADGQLQPQKLVHHHFPAP
jgi:hypothetical protein